MPTFADDALVLDARPYRDRHQLLSILTPTHGLIRGILRRARGGKAPRASATQILSLVRVSGHHAPRAELATYHGVDLVRSTYPLAGSLAHATAAAVVAELLLTFCGAGEPARRPFRLGRTLLDALLEGHDPMVVVAYGQLWSLMLAGLLPPLDRCADCGADLEDGPAVRPSDLQPVCPACSAGRGELLDPPSIRFLMACRRLGVLDIPPPVPCAVAGWLDRLSRAEAERPLRALTFLRTQLP